MISADVLIIRTNNIIIFDVICYNNVLKNGTLINVRMTLELFGILTIP